MHFDQKLFSCTNFLPDNNCPVFRAAGHSLAGPEQGRMPWRSDPQDRHEQLVQKSNILTFLLPHFQFSNCRCCCWNMKLSVKAFPLLLTISQDDKSSAISSKPGAFLTPFPQVRCWVIFTHTHRRTDRHTQTHSIKKPENCYISRSTCSRSGSEFSFWYL